MTSMEQWSLADSMEQPESLVAESLGSTGSMASRPRPH